LTRGSHAGLRFARNALLSLLAKLAVQRSTTTLNYKLPEIWTPRVRDAFCRAVTMPPSALLLNQILRSHISCIRRGGHSRRRRSLDLRGAVNGERTAGIGDRQHLFRADELFSPVSMDQEGCLGRLNIQQQLRTKVARIVRETAVSAT